MARRWVWVMAVLLGFGGALAGGVFAAEGDQPPKIYPTAEECSAANDYNPCSPVEGGWSPGTIVNDTNSPGNETPYTPPDPERERREHIAMNIGVDGTLDHPVVAVDMNMVVFPDVQPYLDKEIGRVRVPVRFVSEQMGAQVAWDNDKQQVTITKENLTILLTVDDPKVVVNGRNIEIDAPPRLVDPGRVMVPLRFVSEAFGAVVDWVGAESPDPADKAWGQYQVWIWIDWGYWGKYTIDERLNRYSDWWYRGPGRD